MAEKKLKFVCPECGSNSLIKEVDRVRLLQRVDIENGRIMLGESIEDFESSEVSRYMCGECNYILTYPENDDYILCEEHIIEWIKMAKKVKTFKCLKCGCKRLYRRLENVICIEEVFANNEVGVFEGEPMEENYDDMEVVEYNCFECDEPLYHKETTEKITTEEELKDWLKDNGIAVDYED